MASLEIVPFTGAHLVEAAHLLAARQTVDREMLPDLPQPYCDPAQTLALLDAALSAGIAHGVAALQERRLVGYLFGEQILAPPLSQMARYVRPRAMIVDYGWHATVSAGAHDIYRALYAAIAPVWLRAGAFSHYVFLPNTRPARETWFSLGFGQESVYGVRETDAAVGADRSQVTGHRSQEFDGQPVEAHRLRPNATASNAQIPGLTMRRAGPKDLQAVVGLLEELERTEAAAPIFRVFLPGREETRADEHRGPLADPACTYWLAEIDGRPVGMQSFVPFEEGRMDAPDSSIHLDEACTAPDLRGSGIGSALLRRGLRAAEAAGYRRCVVDWVAPNLPGSRFWLGQGFRPIATWVVRHVDKRIAWAL